MIMRFRQHGFTLIELLISIAVTSILVGATYTQFRGGQEFQELQNAGDQMLGHVRQLQSRATSSVVHCDQGDFGIYVRPNIAPRKYIAFADCDNDGESRDRFDPNNSADQEIYESETQILSASVKITSFYDGVATNVLPHSILFQSLSGDLFVDGNLMTQDRVSILLEQTSNDACLRIDVLRASKTFSSHEDLDCDPSTN